ncbi:DNA cytosine methyltransferase [uncultured Prevotella sp.]|uniref:DNA cytosine methyltransferase n=1 Tax=uncultured Prevotella sp. TaxID=159272 RepID=UPI0035B084C5
MLIIVLKYTRIVYAVDNDEYCTKIYNDNFAHKCVVKDVRDIKIEEMPQFDMLLLVASLVSLSPSLHKTLRDSDIKMKEECCSSIW